MPQFPKCGRSAPSPCAGHKDEMRACPAPARARVRRPPPPGFPVVTSDASPVRSREAPGCSRSGAGDGPLQPGPPPPSVRSRALTCPPGPTEPEEGREAPDGIMRSRAANPADLRRGEGWGGRASPPSCYREGEAAGGEGRNGGSGGNGAGPCGRGETEARSAGGGGAPDGLSSSWRVPCRPRGAGSHRGGGCA